MKILLASWALLLFGVSLNSGHYIRQAEDANSVYQVKNDPSGVSFINPDGDRRTLREILYYHIIERPREEPVVTERSFTNSHGYQFFDLQQLLGDSYQEEDQEDDGSYVEQAGDEDQEAGDSENNEQEPVFTTTQQPLTDQDVKEAYKAKSYLFDQMRQRYAVKRMAVPEPSLNRRKRQAEMESFPDAPSYSSDSDSKAAYIQPKTYGMNLNGDGGYVWNNLNNPPTYYELGSSNGNPNEGSDPQSQENTPPTSENAYIPPVEPNESESSEDIYIVTNRPSAQPLETVPETANPSNESPEPINENPEPINQYPGPINENAEPINENPGPINENPELINDNPEPINDNPELSNVNKAPINENPELSDTGANYPTEPISDDDNSNDKSEDEGIAINGPEVYENPEPNPVQPETAEPSPQQPEANEYPISESPAEESSENPGYGYGQQPGETKVESSTEESSEGDQFKEIPVAPTLPPLNYDGLPDYIRDAISSSEKPASYEQTDNPYTNPQPNPEDKQMLQDQMEGIFATMQPVEDIPKTYGMNLTSEGGHVWNDMVNPPVSYDVGSPSQSEEEHKEEQPAPVSEQPEPEPAEPEKEDPVANPEEPSHEPEINESEEAKPVEEPAKPERKPEEPVANPSEENHEPPTPENDNKPIEQPAEPTESVESEPATESENPEIQEPGNEQFENPKPVPEAGHELENPEPMPEPGNKPENPKPVPEPGAELDNPEPVPEPDNEPENPEPVSELENEPENSDAVPEPGNEPESPELVREPGNEPENPEPEPDNSEPVPEPDNEPENPEPVSTPELEPENPESVPEPGNEEPENHEFVPEPENEDTEQTSEVPAEESNEEHDKPDIMSELLKSEQFWKWLGEWTATYMELLEKHIRKIAIQEICNREKSGEQMCALEDKPEDNDNDGVIIKDGKIILDGKELDITNTDNLDKGLKRRPQNNNYDNDKKDKNRNNIEAATIYGNSVGNEKVTNVFIFTADKAHEVIENLKPANESEVDFVIEDKIKENESTEKSTEIDTDQSNLGNTEDPDANEETDEGEASNEEPSEDADKSESSNGEPSKEINNEEVIKEESEGDKEYLNKNDSIEGEGNIKESNKNTNEPNKEEKEESSSDIEATERGDDSKLEPSESESN